MPKKNKARHGLFRSGPYQRVYGVLGGQQSLPGFRADNAIGRQVLFSLEAFHRFFRCRTEFTIGSLASCPERTAAVVALVDEQDLSVFHCGAFRAVLQLWKYDLAADSYGSLLCRRRHNRSGIVLTIQRMTVTGNIAVGAAVGVFLHLVGAIALDGDNDAVGHFDHDAGVTDLAAGLEEDLVADLRIPVVAAFLLVILSGENTSGPEWTSLALDALPFDVTGRLFGFIKTGEVNALPTLAS